MAISPEASSYWNPGPNITPAINHRQLQYCGVEGHLSLQQVAYMCTFGAVCYSSFD
jgi:hypothetical protein